MNPIGAVLLNKQFAIFKIFQEFSIQPDVYVRCLQRPLESIGWDETHPLRVTFKEISLTKLRNFLFHFGKTQRLLGELDYTLNQTPWFAFLLKKMKPKSRKLYRTHPLTIPSSSKRKSCRKTIGSCMRDLYCLGLGTRTRQIWSNFCWKMAQVQIQLILKENHCW